jgi:hypothetical protein
LRSILNQPNSAALAKVTKVPKMRVTPTEKVHHDACFQGFLGVSKFQFRDTQLKMMRVNINEDRNRTNMNHGLVRRPECEVGYCYSVSRMDT